VYRGFFRPSGEPGSYGEASPLLVAPLVLTAVLTVVLGVAPNAGVHVAELAQAVAQSIGTAGVNTHDVAGVLP
jgi:hypothetical protein